MRRYGMDLLFTVKDTIMRLRLDVRRSARARLVLGAAMLVHGFAAGAATSSKPLILDTQRGIQDGKGGLVLQTAPLSSEPIVEPAGMRAPAGQVPNTSVPLFVAPYINVPGWGVPPANQPRLAPRPQP
ncbi:hypothetical protein NA66_10704 [Burkholderia pyrrocinia]|uniref:Uncharacterized protein n=3 Tax=Burkholderiaceae TaxID=119060 RepID=A0A318HV05_BURPY|nr:hypothetical protein NA66_10704 [Burkholderia pyrrocinia]SFW91288.1 hypothetical protein SAMN03159384_07193 [Burkholderia sp. NFACC33-1]SFY46647.1 hypothetical protein SAMN03159408_07189 [Burkholderia sp. NFPP32]